MNTSSDSCIPASKSPKLFPPGPRRGLPGAFLIEARRDMLGLLTRLSHEYGDVSRVETGMRPMYFFNHPDAVREVLQSQSHNFVKSRALVFAKLLLGEGLLTSEDPLHRQQRKLIQPAFHYRRLEGYANSMTQYASAISHRWHDGSVVNMHHEMMELTLAIVGKTLLNTEVGAETETVERAMQAIMPLFSRTFLPWAELLNRLPLPATRRFERAKNDLDLTIYRIIAEHKASGDVGDLISMLLSAQDEDGAGMTEQQVRDEALTIFLAGHETTANALTYTWYLLAQHPEVESKLQAEVDDVLQGRPALYSDFENLKYTQMVFSEAIRLYPPAWAIGRRSITDCQILGYHVDKDSLVLISPWVMHRDKRFWAEPLEFKPERFLEEEKTKRPKFSYFPFGSGPRVCIGEGFAWLEGVLIIATLMQRWRMRLTDNRPLELEPLITLRPKNPVKILLSAR